MIDVENIDDATTKLMHLSEIQLAMHKYNRVVCRKVASELCYHANSVA
jgi:hypothetical protein